MKNPIRLTVIALLLSVSTLSAATHYVSLGSANPTPPYTNWVTAATNIQDAVNVAATNDVVVVTNGVFPGGVAVTKLLTLLSVNGPQVTVINGGGTNRCVSLTSGTSLSGFTLTNGSAALGGGVSCTSSNALLTNCVITGCSAIPDAFGGGGGGGGADGGTLYNCTLTGNQAKSWGGGARGSTLRNCTLTSNSVYDCTLTGNWVSKYGGGAYQCTLVSCALAGNSAAGVPGPMGGIAGFGGAADRCALYNCALIGNSALYGGGAESSTLCNCTLSSNSVAGLLSEWYYPGCGGAADGCTLSNCTLSANSSTDYGGGAEGGTLYNCTLSGNSAGDSGGGASEQGTLYNCTLSGNSAGDGGGAYLCTLYNCTVTDNSAYVGGGVSYGSLYNCIVYFNTAPDGANYYSTSTLNYCCTTPLPGSGVGNLALDPQLGSTSHLSAGSPCRGAGSAGYAGGIDIDGEAWGSPPSIGCDEYRAGAVTGPLAVGLAGSSYVRVGYSLSLAAVIEGRTSGSVWDFGDGTVVSNRPCASHAWAAAGDYEVVLRAYNESLPGGVSASVTIHVVTQLVLYVAAVNLHPQPPYASWGTAATNIQDAVDAAATNDVVVVTNGVYPGSVTVTNPVTLRSVNGPQFTVIDGGGTDRCISLSDGASLTGFTLTKGLASIFNYVPGMGISGGGVWCASTNAFLTNCIIAGNSAVGWAAGWFNFPGSGGGAFMGTLYNCTLSGNSASALYPYGGGGGGAYGSSLYNCTLSGNSADSGGGASASFSGPCTLYNCTVVDNVARYSGGGVWAGMLYSCTVVDNMASDFGGGVVSSALFNCIVAYNAAWTDDNYSTDSTLDYCCTEPLLTNGVGNISVPPEFVDYPSGNLRLRSNSPCINAGNNSYLTDSNFTNCFDLDGSPRIVSGAVDIGAYEYQATGSRISYAWLQQYGLPTDGSADFIDSDHDGLNNWQEWVCGTNPTNALSALRMVSAFPARTNATVTWQSVVGINYFLQRSTNLAAPFALLASNIVGQAGTTSFADTNAAGPGPFFYRVGVNWP